MNIKRREIKEIPKQVEIEATSILARIKRMVPRTALAATTRDRTTAVKAMIAEWMIIITKSKGQRLSSSHWYCKENYLCPLPRRNRSVNSKYAPTCLNTHKHAPFNYVHHVANVNAPLRMHVYMHLMY